ncbi:ATP-binding protein [Arthrobacter sp. HY1533]|uniref:ATP-binding protein n=1 Tax=Arthrobacter sp. HY1533 TaxID=2970919 RepID=UPI0022B9FF2A|nr:ATP-binding protein [Arthrobacter sp. HY1533]
MSVWLNDIHGVGKTTTAAFVPQLFPDSHVFDAEKVDETPMDVHPGLPDMDNFQNWPPWRSLVVETAQRILDYTGGTFVIPMTVLAESYWREISHGLAAYGIPVRHFVLHADQGALRRKNPGRLRDGPLGFRFSYLTPCTEAFQGWLARGAHIIETSAVAPARAASEIVASVNAS